MEVSYINVTSVVGITEVNNNNKKTKILLLYEILGNMKRHKSDLVI